MEAEKNLVTTKTSDCNGNNPEFHNTANKVKILNSTVVKDHIITNDGRILYPCQFCNKVFPIKKARSTHIESCSAKDYILSVGKPPVIQIDITQESRNGNIPNYKKCPKKIDIQQNIILNKQMNVSEILSKSKSPLSLNISRTISSDSDNSNFSFKVNNSQINQNGVPDFNFIAKRLENNSVIITKQKIDKSFEEERKIDESSHACRVCKKLFSSPIELLRHSRKCHSYPKVIMALSEIKKFYSAEDRSECPICHKPLKTNFRSAFVKHLHTHSNETKFSCSVCNRKFGRADHMKAHEKRHVINGKRK